MKISETSDGKIDFVNVSLAGEYRQYIAINDIQKKKVTFLQVITNKPVFSLADSQFLFSPEEYDNYDILTFYHWRTNSYSIRKATDFSLLADKLTFPSIPTVGHVVLPQRNESEKRDGFRYVEFLMGENRCFYDLKQKRLITVPGIVEDVIVLSDGVNERLVASFWDKNKKGKLYVDGIQTPYDLYADRGMMVNAEGPLFFGSNSDGLYGMLNIFTGEMILPFEYRPLKSSDVFPPYVNDKKQMLFIHDVIITQYKVYDEFLQSMEDSSDAYYKVRIGEEYWIVNANGEPLLKTEKEAKLLAPLNVDALGHPLYTDFGVQVGEKTTYYYDGLHQLKEVPIYTKEQLQFNTLNFYLTDVFREYTEFPSLYFVYEQNKYYLTNSLKDKLDNQGYVRFYSEDTDSAQYLIAIIKDNETFDLYTKDGIKINNKVGPLDFFEVRDVKSTYFTPFDMFLKQNNVLRVQSKGKIYEVKDGQLIEINQ